MLKFCFIEFKKVLNFKKTDGYAVKLWFFTNVAAIENCVFQNSILFIFIFFFQFKDILDGSDEETQVAEILNDLANIGPTYHDEVILCPEYKSSGICSRMYCNKEHVYPIGEFIISSQKILCK